MNETFIRKNDIGVDIEYHIIAKVKDENRDYIIYTDLVNDEIDTYRLFVDMITNDKYVPISETGKNMILNKFRDELSFYFNQLNGDD